MWIFCFSVLLTKGTHGICSFGQPRWFCQKQCINLFRAIVKQLEAKGFLMPTLWAGNQKAESVLSKVMRGWKESGGSEGGLPKGVNICLPAPLLHPPAMPFLCKRGKHTSKFRSVRTDFICWLDKCVFHPGTLWMPYHCIIIILNHLFLWYLASWAFLLAHWQLADTCALVWGK